MTEMSKTTSFTSPSSAPKEYDIIVLGAGAAGMSAACVAAALGRSVLLLEHTDRVGGTTAISGGMVWIPDNHKMRSIGVADSLAQAREYLRATVSGADDSHNLQTFLSRGEEANQILESNSRGAVTAGAPLPRLLPQFCRFNARCQGFGTCSI